MDLLMEVFFLFVYLSVFCIFSHLGLSIFRFFDFFNRFEYLTYRSFDTPSFTIIDILKLNISDSHEARRRCSATVGTPG